MNREITVLPGRIPYTSEKDAHLVVIPPVELNRKKVQARAVLGKKTLVRKCTVPAGTKTALKFPARLLPHGMSDVACCITINGEETPPQPVTFTKLPPKSNEVKINHVGRGLIVDGLPFLPFGFYCNHTPSTKALPRLIDEEVCQGFNMMMPYHDRPKNKKEREAIRRYMDRCAETGMKVMYAAYWFYWPRNRKMGGKQWEEYRREIADVADHPALLGYYLADEPGLVKLPADLLNKAYNEIKAVDPYHPVMLVHIHPRHASKYPDCLDIVMGDPYPIPDRKVTFASYYADRFKKIFNGRLPVWIAPQAFGGVHWWRREPSRQEQRVMTYLSMIHDATGIMYFINTPRYNTPSYVSPNSPRLWNECRALALETAELTPALLSAEPQPELICGTRGVHAAAWTDRGVITILAANTLNKPARCRLRLKNVSWSGKADVMFEDRKVSVRNGRIEDMIDAFGTRAYQLPVGPLPKERLRIHKHNLVENPSFEHTPNVGTPGGCCTTNGTGIGATYFVDSRTAVHGRHSLRLRAPKGEVVGIVPVRFRLKAGRSYRVSIWGKSDTGRPSFTLGLDHATPARKTFKLTTEWKEYSMTCRTKEQTEAAEPFLQVTSGTAWFDLFQAVPVDGPKGEQYGSQCYPT